MNTQLLEQISSKPLDAKISPETRIQKAVVAYDRACKAASFQQRLKLDALESLADSKRLLKGAHF